MPYGNRDNENTFGKEREAYTAIDRPENYRAKLANASFRTARPGPPGFGEKSSSPGGLAVFFPPTLHNPARDSQGGKEIEYIASPVICIT